MARLTNKQDLSPVIHAARKWMDACLIEDGSVLSSSQLWAPSVIEEVRKAFVGHPDASEAKFGTKLKSQMKEASTRAQQLMAEMLWALLLFPTNVKPDTKRQQIRDMWSLSG